MNADRIQIEWDEDGCWLIVEPDRSDSLYDAAGAYRFGLPDPEQAYDAVKGGIGPWLRERDEAWGEFKEALQSGTGPAAAFVCRDIDESGGMADEYAVAIREDGSLRMEPDEDAYDPTDPKHPRYHSIHADIHDLRERGGQ